MKYLLILFLASIPFRSALWQETGEKNIFSFKTTKGKALHIALNESTGKLIYRFGNASSVELEFISKGESNEDFTYSYYSRGGGPGNAGLDLNYLRFSIDDYTYWVYEEYSAESDQEQIGIKILKKNKTIAHLQGDTATKMGSLIRIRFMDSVKQDDVTLN